jgi:hypothetical protein
MPWASSRSSTRDRADGLGNVAVVVDSRGLAGVYHLAHDQREETARDDHSASQPASRFTCSDAEMTDTAIDDHPGAPPPRTRTEPSAPHRPVAFGLPKGDERWRGCVKAWVHDLLASGRMTERLDYWLAQPVT